jgi:hypothetical protein
MLKQSSGKVLKNDCTCITGGESPVESVENE